MYTIRNDAKNRVDILLSLKSPGKKSIKVVSWGSWSRFLNVA